jgi:hypothetical protein
VFVELAATLADSDKGGINAGALIAAAIIGALFVWGIPALFKRRRKP